MTTVLATIVAAFTILGITDENNTCDCCGRTGLKRTVLLGVTDADGNVDSVVYYGTGCAAVALGRSRTDGTKVADMAAAAERDWQERAVRAREILAVYGPVEGNIRETAAVFFTRNPHMRDRCRASVMVAEMLSTARATLAERGLTA